MNLKKILVEQLSPESDFGKILAIKKGTVDKTDIEFSSEYIINFDDKYMYFDFDDSENYLKYFLDPEYAEDGYGIEEIDQQVYALNYGFSGDEYLDWSNVDDEWENGYPIGILNTENKEKLDKIILLLKPDGQDLIEKGGKSNWITSEMVLNDEVWDGLWNERIGDMVKDSIQTYLTTNGFSGDSMEDRLLDYNIDKIINGENVNLKK